VRTALVAFGLTVSLGVTAPVTAAAGAPVSAPSGQSTPSDPGATGVPGTAVSESAARAAAVASGRRVEVLSERTEFSQLFAEPTGRLT
jgi:hypothetical protein